jgi:hypothetical protein
MMAVHRLVSGPAGARPIHRVHGALTTARAYTLDDAISAAAPGAVIGPLQEGGGHVVAQLLAREAATALDSATRRAVLERLMQEWLAVRARDVSVRWNWI